MGESAKLMRRLSHIARMCQPGQVRSMATSSSTVPECMRPLRYFFDVHGFVVLRGLLSGAEVGSLNSAVDANEPRFKERPADLRNSKLHSFQGDGVTGRKDAGDMLMWDKPHCDPFRSLLAHPSLVPLLNMLLGDGYRLDHLPLLIRQQKGAEGFDFHGGAVGAEGVFNDEIEYKVRPGPAGEPRIMNKLVNVAFALTHTRPGDGGFVIYPGSHKAHFPMPEKIANLDQGWSDLVHTPVLAPGDVVVFSEATAHGALPWCAEHERRSLFFRFSPATSAYGRGYTDIFSRSLLDALTPAQAAVLQPPFHTRLDRPVLRSNGANVEKVIATPRGDLKKNFDQNVFGTEYF